MRHLLAYRDTRLLLAGQTLSAFGDWAMLIVLAVWMKTLTGSSALAGLRSSSSPPARCWRRSAGCSPTGCGGGR